MSGDRLPFSEAHFMPDEVKRIAREVRRRVAVWRKAMGEA